MAFLRASAPPRENLPVGSIYASSLRGARQVRCWGWSVSLLLHAAVLAALWPVMQPARVDPQPVITVSACFAPASAPSALSVAASAVTDVAELTPELVRTRFQTLLEQQQGRSVDEQLDRLDSASRQLSRLTSDRSLDELAGHFQTWLGSGERATEPAAATTGEFDENTAQLHDVTRYAKPGGTWAYRCILLDAAGRTLEVDMDGEHGRTAYELMQRIRGNPLLGKLYRDIVMPLVDHLNRPDSPTVPAPSAAMPAPISGDKKRPAE